MIVWDDKYNTGVSHIDLQHKQLFYYISKLEEAASKDDLSSEMVNDTMDFLEMYTKVHFCYEEVCMVRASCKIAKKNKVQHDSFIEIFETFKDRLEKDMSKEIVIELYQLAEKWIVNHIMKIDTNLKPCASKLNLDSKVFED